MAKLTVVEILETIENTQGKLAKQAILAEHANNDLLKEVFRLVQHPYINFYLGKVPKVKNAGGEAAPKDSHLVAMLDALQKCINRDVTGNAARALVADTLVPMTDLEFKWASRIILRKMRTGIGEGSVEKTWPGLVPSFKVALADKVEWEILDKKAGTIKILTKINYPVRCEPKWDGYRCIVVKKNGVVTMFSRSGTETETAPTVKAWLQEHMLDSWVLDGELIDSNNWNDTASVVSSRKNKKSDKTLSFFVWDCMPLDVWVSQGVSKKFSERLKDIPKALGGRTSGPVKIAEGNIVYNEKELLSYYNECLTKGYEGIMVKVMDAVYEFDRSEVMLKLKPVADYDGVVVGVGLGREGTKWEKSFTTLMVRFPWSTHLTRVVTGTDDNEKLYIDSMRDKLIGTPLTLEGSPILGEDGKVRFPVFIKWRQPSDCAPEVRKLIEEVKK